MSARITSHRALVEIDAARAELLERSMPPAIVTWVPVSRPAPDESNLFLPAFLAHQAE